MATPSAEGLSAGVTVFGSAALRVRPDRVSFRFEVSDVQPEAPLAFTNVQTAAAAVVAFLREAGQRDVGMSRILLRREERRHRDADVFVGYSATTEFEVLLGDVTQLESLLVGLVGLGVTEITNVQYQTSRLKEFRQQARRESVRSAREKAALYAEAAQVTLGPVLAIQDLDPSFARHQSGHLVRASDPEDAAREGQSLDPTAIVLRAAVQLVFALNP